MPALTADDILDLVKGTLRHLGRPKFEQIAQTLQRYEVFPKWFKKDKATFDHGIGIQRSLMTRLSTAARHVGFTAVLQHNIEDLIEQMYVPWRHAETHWSYIFQETLMNRGEALIFNILKPRRVGAMLALVDILEAGAWSAPASSSDKTEPFGIPYWVVKNATAGFNGGAPSGHTTVAGIDLTANPTFKNYTFQYTNPTKADLVTKLRKMHRKLDWKAPVSSPDLSKGMDQRNYVNETLIASIEDIGEAQNENLGRDIASMDGGRMTFRRDPIIPIVYLDADTTNPWYMIDHATFMPVFLSGDYLREDGPDKNPNQRNVYTTLVNLTYNYVCHNRRRNGVGYV